MYEISIAILGGLVVGCAILLCIYVTFKVDDRTDAVKNFPTKIVDAHHHFLDPTQSFHATLKTLGAPAYTPEQYADDAGTLPIVKTVHVEALADEGASEAAWVSSLADTGRCNVAAIVASCDLSADDAPAKLAALVAASPRVRGVRWILNYDGPFDGKVATATWPKVRNRRNRFTPCAVRANWIVCVSSLHTLFLPSNDTRKEQDTPPPHHPLRPPRLNDDVRAVKVEADFLREPARRDAFERGFAALAAHNLTFDLQCNPAQLGAAADLCARHPATRVVLDHLGTPRHLWMLKAGTVGGSAAYRASDERKLTEWRAAMERFAEVGRRKHALRRRRAGR